MIITEMRVTKTVETKTAHISLLDDRIVRLEVKDNAHLICENLEENYHVYSEMLNGEKAPIFNSC